MRKFIIPLLFVVAFVFALAPIAMADEPITHANNTSQRAEGDHTDYGMDAWITSFYKTYGDPLRLGGDNAYGYYTGLNPGFNGDAGMGLIDEDDTNHALGAPSYTSPCPEFADSNGGEAHGGCEANIDTDEQQTGPTELEWDIPIIDDMLAKMWDFRANNDRMAQTLDILFYLSPAASQGVLTDKDKLFIDQTLDQDLADYTGGINSYVTTAGVGIVQRLTQLFQREETIWKTMNGNIPHDGATDADFIDQWLLSYTKDITEPAVGQKIGVVSSISSWFLLDKPELDCPDCIYTYPTGHDPVVKIVPEVDGHPNDDIPDP